MIPRLRALLAATFLIALTHADAADTQTVTVTVPTADTLAIAFPATWQQKVIQAPRYLPPTVKLTSAAVSLQITFIPDPEGRFTTRRRWIAP